MASESETVRADLIDRLQSLVALKRGAPLHAESETEAAWIEEAIAALRTPSAEAKDGACEWRYHDNDGAWLTGCGQAWSYVDGGPAENHHNFCHCCGKAIAIAQQPKADAGLGEVSGG